MEKIFITMHDLSPEARVVYASDSVTDVLGYPPADVVGLSCFDFFHPDQLPFARKVHTRGIHLDRAAVLVYCQVRHKDGSYVDCETIFSVVYDVFVAATSLHVPTSKSQGRAMTAPVIRRVFSASQNDPRYHMLTHLSTKFRMENVTDREQHEPRAALILNRFTRTLPVLYASHATTRIFGLTPEQLAGKSFFECIDPDCLQDAVDALERAKENDSIAYLRFRWRDPTGDCSPAAPTSSSSRTQPAAASLRRSTRISAKRKADDEGEDGEGSARPAKRRGAVPRRSGETSATASSGATRNSNRDGEIPVEVEAVVSCTSDGLVVILRAARPLIPKPLHEVPGGVFASPWAPNPLVPAIQDSPAKARENTFMEAIREVAVFAWSLRQLGGEVFVPDGETSSAEGSKKSGSKKAKRESDTDAVTIDKSPKKEAPKSPKDHDRKAVLSAEDTNQQPEADVESKTPRRRKQGRR